MDHFEEFLKCMSALAFIRGYIRAEMSTNKDAHTLRLLGTINEKATETLISVGVEVADKPNSVTT